MKVPDQLDAWLCSRCGKLHELMAWKGEKYIECPTVPERQFIAPLNRDGTPDGPAMLPPGTIERWERERAKA